MDFPARQRSHARITSALSKICGYHRSFRLAHYIPKSEYDRKCLDMALKKYQREGNIYDIRKQLFRAIKCFLGNTNTLIIGLFKKLTLRIRKI